MSVGDEEPNAQLIGQEWKDAFIDFGGNPQGIDFTQEATYLLRFLKYELSNSPITDYIITLKDQERMMKKMIEQLEALEKLLATGLGVVDTT